MTAAFDDLVRSTVETFLAAEFPGGRPGRAAAPTLAAIGTLAPRALASPLLRDRLMAAGVAAARSRPFADPPALLADQSWRLALVLSPYKRTVAASCQRLAPAAVATGVVDTLLRVERAALGVNTNAYAAAGAVGRLLGGAQPARALIAGSGASARSVGYGLRLAYPALEVGLVARSAERATEVVAQLGFGQVVARPAAFAADLVINTTTVGETDDRATLAFDLPATFGPGVRYFDLNNRPSALQLAALEAGCVTSSGVVMQILTNALRAALLA
jgi:shikimate dehydrogenase